MKIYFIGGAMDLTKQIVSDTRPRKQISILRNDFCDSYPGVFSEAAICPMPNEEIYQCCGQVLGQEDTYVYSHIGTISHVK